MTVLAAQVPPLPRAAALPSTRCDAVVAPERSLFDLLVREGRALDVLLLDEERLASSIQWLILLGVAGLGLYGLVLGLVCTALRGELLFELAGRPALWLPVAVPGAFVASLAICVPSFYFYTQIAGLDASFRLVTAQALRVQARTTVLLLGVLPFYVAYALAAVLGVFVEPTRAVMVGFALPFVVGLFGIVALRRSFGYLITVLPITHPRRGCFLNRMVLAWGAVYSAVCPVALYRLGELLARWL